MRIDDIRKIAAEGRFPGPKTPVELVETHISWVLLTPAYAFKMKKPVRFDFLDFSTPELRRFYCEEEVRLNRRLAPEIYLGVLPVGLSDGALCIGAEPALDYAVQMRRMDSALQMDRMLRDGAVRVEQLGQLAARLAAFHRAAVLPADIACDVGAVWADFADLYTHREAIERYLGPGKWETLAWMRAQLEPHLQRYSARLRERAESGFWVEGHGDLHSRNIFLSDPPVAFDCIEFSTHLRQMDVLNELAFLAMDLDFHGRRDLSAAFLDAYRRHWNVLPHPDDVYLFHYFKAYRANVRLKIALIELEQQFSEKALLSARRYGQLLGVYVRALFMVGF